MALVSINPDFGYLLGGGLTMSRVIIMTTQRIGISDLCGYFGAKTIGT